MKNQANRGSKSTHQSDPINMLKAEHHSVLLRLETMERTLQYLESLSARTAPERWTNEVARFQGGLAALQQGVGLHFLKEENALFPVLSEYIGQAEGAIEIMRDEHARIRKALLALRAQSAGLTVWKGEGSNLMLSAVTELAYETMDLLRLHIRKENQILFEICEGALSLEEKKKITQKIESM